tara:strand:+ start:165 stop:602 length:438 start_codon:yes stop_codon:yes gene_type:complete
MATAMAIPGWTQSPTEPPPPMGLPVCGYDAPPSYPANAPPPVAIAMALPADMSSAYPAYPAAAVQSNDAPPSYPAYPACGYPGGAAEAPPVYPSYPTVYPGGAASSSGASEKGDLPPGLSQKVSSACLGMADRTKHRGSCMTSGI